MKNKTPLWVAVLFSAATSYAQTPPPPPPATVDTAAAAAAAAVDVVQKDIPADKASEDPFAPDAPKPLPSIPATPAAPDAPIAPIAPGTGLPTQNQTLPARVSTTGSSNFQERLSRIVSRAANEVDPATGKSSSGFSQRLQSIITKTGPDEIDMEPEIEETIAEGLMDEDRKLDLERATDRYRTLIDRFDRQRAGAAQAIFRLAECYRKLGRMEEAKTLYARILREFPDQAPLVQASQKYVFGNPKIISQKATVPLPSKIADPVPMSEAMQKRYGLPLPPQATNAAVMPPADKAQAITPRGSMSEAMRKRYGLPLPPQATNTAVMPPADKAQAIAPRDSMSEAMRKRYGLPLPPQATNTAVMPPADKAQAIPER